jgi:hypothetical protein
MDDDDYCEPPFICPLSKQPCIRAFCEDYGCADQACVPLDENDFACGSIDDNELMPKLPRITP